MASVHEFIASDNQVNRYGFRVLTEGIRTENYMKNPVVLAYHDDCILAVGKAIAISKDADGKFRITVDFDEQDEFAMLLYNKYKNGYMSAVSLGLLNEVESVDEKDLLPGQHYPTITQSDMLELSLVNVPGNVNAIKLYGKEMNEVKLSMIETNLKFSTMSKEEKTVEQLLAENQALRKDRAKDMIALHVKRGAITDGEAGFFEKSAESDFEGTKKVLELRPDKKDETADKEKMAGQLVELHFTRGAITADEKEFFSKSATLDYEGAKKVLEARKGKETVDSFVASQHLGAPGKKEDDPEDRSKWTYLDFYKKDPDALGKMKTETPEKYKTLLDGHKNALRKSGKVSIDTEDEN
ncbi:MAG: HK97 family phage prohead protease [Bacteroidota bacterium]